MQFWEKYQEYLEKINRELEQVISKEPLPQKTVLSAMHYVLRGGGKRIRPVLTLAVCDLLGGDTEDGAKAAVAIECVHNYSLVHDDLPCMDDDDLRRGRPTCHKAFSENVAVLAGDGLLNLAFELLSDKSRYRSFSDSTLLSLIGALSRASGVYGMIGGQVIDLESEGKADVSISDLEQLHCLKTGAMIRASVECGCICAGCAESDSRREKLLRYAEDLGLAFQIQDDVLDVIGSEQLLGKPVGSDAESRKNTFVTLLGIEKAQAEVARLTKRAEDAIRDIPDAEFLTELAEYLLKRKN